jgi:hypothetical protein
MVESRDFGSSNDIGYRLARIEERIDKHDQAIKRALAIAASYIQGNVA